MPKRGSAGGRALKAKVHPLYFVYLGRRGGRRSKRNELLRFALEAAYPECWIEKAMTQYHDEDCGTGILIALWSPEVIGTEGNIKLKKHKKRRKPYAKS